jgi:Mg2+-importing ATPase
MRKRCWHVFNDLPHPNQETNLVPENTVMGVKNEIFFINSLTSSRAPASKRAGTIRFSKRLMDISSVNLESACEILNTTLRGISTEEAEERLEKYGFNEIAREKRQTWLLRLGSNLENPLVILLTVLGIISYLTGDIRATVIIFAMVLLGIILRFVQESRADSAAEKLQEMVRPTATVLRDGRRQEIPLKNLVPGDVVALSSGDMVPGDLRLISAKDLFVNQSALTGESLPIEKMPQVQGSTSKNPFEIANLLFFGTNVESGTGLAMVVQTGITTYFGSLASSVTGKRQQTSFDKGVNDFTWLMISFMLVMVPLVFLFNGLSKGDWIEAFLFALAVAVGLTPEMLRDDRHGEPVQGRH